ncbi:hypothetical protein [Aporhodopirellula aestuarii]|uniref:Uncharacterized protein n=1 Tax=Aporhodopirellula aestuarii TaxID=2950107 RepID=A0ABT0U4I3_9BACT|nr:hypothetical protein [Aporhodopirellula aestuarii]MCM2371766.1 hypothetical protein [Aporhodopirellula aestuarii]
MVSSVATRSLAIGKSRLRRDDSFIDEALDKIAESSEEQVGPSFADGI